MYDVVILTDHRYENPKKIDWYIQQVLTEDKLLKKELELLGLNVIIKDWKSKKFDWTKAEYVDQNGNNITLDQYKGKLSLIHI